MTNDVMLGSLYLLMAGMLVLGALINRREPFAKLAVMALAWLSIFGAGFVLFTFRDDLGFIAQRLKTEATGEPFVAGSEVRIPMAIDGHFWVDGMINGTKVKFLVDSGATVTTIGRATAIDAGATVADARDQVVRTGNGVIKVARGRAQRLQIAAIERDDVGLHIVDGDDINVLGMNFLSTLTRWGVEGRWLILQA
ncbi:MAG: TIGR02281 family clan AA aspartic protease [Pseudomonadota bacterium]|nr:TIGR02281 family clan AA aspartic protease [Pseudomonadota bacterium]